MTKPPYHALETMIMKLGADRVQKVEEIRYLRRERRELETLLRSALAQLAQERHEKRPRVFADTWIRERREMNL